MSAKTSGDVSHINDEDVLRRMWQDTEDFGRKKEIRSHMYKLREERLRNFYTSSESTNEIHRTQSTPGLHEKTIAQGNGPTHADSLADHSFLSLKSKEIRDSESPVKEMLPFKTDKNRGGNQGWNVVSKSEVSDDGKTYTTSKIATTAGSENVDGVHANYAAKCEQTSSSFKDGDKDNFTKSSATSSKNVIKQEAKGGDDNSNFQSFSTSSSSSSKVVTQHHSTTGDNSDFRRVPSSIDDSSSNQIIRKVYTTDVPAELKISPNYIDGNTKVTTETRTLPDGSKVTTTRYETRGISTSSDKHTTNTQNVSQQRSSTIQNTQNIKYIPDTFDNEPSSTTIKVYKTSNDDVERNVVQDAVKSSSTVIQKSHRVVDSKNVDITNEQNVINQKPRNVPSTIDQDDVRTIQLIRENEYLPRDDKSDVSDQRPTSTSSTTTRKEVITTKGGTTKTKSENIHDTHVTKVIREDEYGRHPKNERPDHERSPRGYTLTVSVPRDNQDPYFPQSRKPNDVSTPDEHVRTSHVTKESITKTTSQNIQDTDVIKVRENEFTRRPKDEQPDFERPSRDNRDTHIPEGRKPEDYPSKASTPGHYTPRGDYTPGSRTPASRPTGDNTPTPNQIITRLIPHSEQPEQYDFYKTNTSTIQTTRVVDQEPIPQTQCAVPDRRQPTKPQTREEIITTTTVKQVQSVHKNDYTSKRISVDVSPTHEAFARSLRAISPDRDRKPGSTRSLKSSTCSLRSSTSPEKRPASRTTPERKPTPDLRPSSRGSSPTKGTATPTKRTPNQRETSPKKTTPIDSSTLTRRPKNQPRSRSTSPTSTASDIEFVRNVDVTKTQRNTRKEITDKRPTTLNLTSPSSKKPKSSTDHTPTSPSKESPTKKTPQDKPFHRRDTYEERCRQILGITEKTTESKRGVIKPKDSPTSPDKQPSNTLEKPHTTKHTSPLKEHPSQTRPGINKQQPKKQPNEVNEPTYTKKTISLLCVGDETEPDSKQPGHKTIKKDSAGPYAKPTDKPGYKHTDEPKKGTPGRPGITEYQDEYCTTKETTESTRKTTVKGRTPERDEPHRRPERPDEPQTGTVGRPIKPSSTGNRPRTESPERATTVTKLTDQYRTTDETVVESTRKTPSKDRKPETGSPERPHTRRPETELPDDGAPKRPKEPQQNTSGRPTRPGTESPEMVTNVMQYTDEYHSTRTTKIPKYKEPTTTLPDEPQRRTGRPIKPGVVSSEVEHPDSPDEPVRPIQPLTHRPETKSPDRFTRITQKTDETVIGSRDVTKYPDEPSRITHPSTRRSGTESPDRTTKLTRQIDETTIDTTRTTWLTGKRPDSEYPGQVKRPDEGRPIQPGDESPKKVIGYSKDGQPETGSPEKPRGVSKYPDELDRSTRPSTRRPGTESPDRVTKITQQTDETVTDTTRITTWPTHKSPDVEGIGTPKRPDQPQKGTARRPTGPGAQSPSRVTEYTDEYCITDETVVESTKKTLPKGTSPDKTRRPGTESPERITRVTQQTDETTIDTTRKTTWPIGKRPETESPGKPKRPNEPQRDIGGRPIKPSSTGRRPGTESPEKETTVMEYTDEYCTTDETVIDSITLKGKKSEPQTTARPGYPHEPKIGRPKKTTIDRQPEEYPEEVTEYTENYYITDKTIVDKTGKTSIPQGRKSGYPDESTPGKRPGESPDRFTQVTEKYYITDETVVDNRKTTTPKSKKPEVDLPTRPGQLKEPKTDRPTKPSTTGRSPEESTDSVTEYTDEYCTTKKTLIDSTSKTVPKGRKPDSQSPTRPGYPDQPKSTTTGRPTRPLVTGRSPGETPDSTTDYIEEFYITDETTIDSIKQSTLPKDRKPGYPHEPTTGGTGRPIKQSTIGRRPDESPDRATTYTDEYYTTNETVIDSTRKTTAPKGRIPEYTNEQKPSRPTKPSITGRRPGESPDRVSEYTDEYCITNETVIDNTTKITSKRPETQSPTRPRYPEEPKTRRPIKPSTTGRKPGESPDRVTKRTEEYYTIDQTTRKTSTPIGKKPQTESPERPRGTTKRPDEPKKGTHPMKPSGRKPGSESPNRVTEYTDHYYVSDKTDKTKITTTTKGTRPERVYGAPKQPDEPKRGTPVRPTKPTITGRKPGRESPESMTRITEYTDEYCTTNETIVDSTKKIQTPKGLNYPDDSKKGPIGRPLKPTTSPKGRKPETASPGRHPDEPRRGTTKPTTERRPEKESPDRFTRVSEYRDEYYSTNKTVTGSTKTPRGKRPEVLPDKSKRRPDREPPVDSERPDSPGRKSLDSEVRITEYTDQYRITDETVGKPRKDSPQRKHRPSTDSPVRDIDYTDEYYTADGTVVHENKRKPKHPGRESPERFTRVTTHTDEYRTTDELVFDSNQRKTVRKTGSPERPRGIPDRPIETKRGTPRRSTSREPSIDDYYLTNTTQTSKQTITQTSKRPESKSPERLYGVPKQPSKPGTTITRRPQGETPGKVGKVTTSSRPAEPSYRRPAEQDKAPGRSAAPTKQITTDIQTRKTVTKNLVDVRQTKTKPKPQDQVNGKRHVVTTTIQVVPKTKPDNAKKIPGKQISKTRTPLEYDSDIEKDIVDEEEVHTKYTTEESYKSTHKTDAKLTRTTSDRVIKSPYKVPVRGQSKPDVFNSYRPTHPDEPMNKKVITTKSIIINNDYDDEKEVIVSLHRSKSSREPTPDTVYPRPTTDEEDGSIPRYPDEIREPDEPNYRRKPTKLSDIPLVESEVTSQFPRYQQKPDVDKVDDSDECLLSVTQKVNRFVSQAEKLSRSPTRKSPRPEIVIDEIDESPKTSPTIDRYLPERPKSPKCQNHPDESFTSVTDKVTHFTETTEKVKVPQKVGHTQKPRRPDFADTEETIRTDHSSLSVSDRVTKFSTTTEKPVSLSKMDVPGKSPRTQSPSKIITECVQIDSEEDTYTRRQSKPDDKTPTKHISKSETDTQSKRHVKKGSPANEPDSTPKTSRKDDDSKSVLSPTARLRSTESVRKAKQLFENIATEQKYTKDILSRPSVFDRKMPKKPGNEDVKLTDIGVKKYFSDENHETRRSTYTTDQLKSVHLVRGRPPRRPHSSERDGDVPHYMRPLDRSVRPLSPYHYERSHSPTERSESPRARSPRPHDSSLDNVPHYMWPLDRTVHDHSVERSPMPSREPTPDPHSKRRSRDSSPDSSVPGYMRPLDRHTHHHDDVDHPNKSGAALRHTESGRTNTAATVSTIAPQRCIPTIKEIEKILATDEIEEIYEVELLEILLERTVSYEQRRRVRSQIRVVKQLIADNKLSTVLNRKRPKSKFLGKPGDDEPGDEYETSYTHSDRQSSHVKHSELATKVIREKVELKRMEPHTKTIVEEKPSWVTQRPLKKLTDSPSTKKTTSTTVVKKKESRMSPSKDRKPIDDITSGYGVGPTDENGSPLFGLRALRAQNRTDTTKVQGTVIRSHYYSENGQEPTGEVSFTKYSTDPNDFDDHVEETNGIVSVTTMQKFGTKGAPSYKSVVGNKNMPDDFEGDDCESVIRKSSTTSVTRRGSVKEMSKKFIDNAVETSKNERQASYPKAGLILRTSSFKDTANRDNRDSSPENRETVMTTVKKTTTGGARTDTFLNNQTRVRGVQDVITRMKNADDEVQPGDSPEDSEARTLLNKFIGTQVILSGMESRSSSSPSGTAGVKRTTTTTTTTTTGKGGGKPTVITRTFTHPITQEDLDTIWDEQTLQLLLERSTDYEERRIIRGRLRDVMAEQEVCADDVTKTKEESSGGVDEKVETSKRTFTQGPVTTTQVTTRVTSQQSTKKPISPFAKFRQLDKQNSLNTPPGTPRTPTGQRPLFKFTDPELSRQASTVKERLLQWCQMKTKEYENVQLDNFSTSWADGLAFCALIHHFLPDAFDYHALTPKDRRHNFTLAFRVADEKADILPLLDVDDMVATRKPDWKCVFTYVQTIYSRFKGED